MQNEDETCSCHCNLPESSEGPPGCRGIPGYAGEHGKDGQHQPDCDDGQDGKMGIPGVPGKDGLQGPPSMNGQPGRPGNDGKDGVPGPPGGQGEKGRPGELGPKGLPGLQGLRGPPGGPGNNGNPGRRGGNGRNGFPGKAGRPGLPGRPGPLGPQGKKGINGAAGAQGRRGLTGPEGKIGRPGRPGHDSTMRGHPGTPGDNGPQGEAGDNAEFDWRAIEVMVANSLFAKLMKPSQYCGRVTEMCKCGEVRVIPTPAPILPPPEKEVLDVILLMDGSDSIQMKDWEPLKSWVLKFMNEFSQQEYISKFAKTSTKVVVQYSSYDFTNGPDKLNPGYIVKKKLLHQLRAFEKDLNDMIQLAHGTDTFTAIEFVLNDIIPNKLDNRGRHNRQLILLTNGVPRDPRIGLRGRQMTNNQLWSSLSENFSDRYVVGIGSEISTNPNELEMIGSNSHGGQAMWLVDSIMSSDDYRQSYLDDELMESILEEMRISLLN